jgi:hypothetical protein
VRWDKQDHYIFTTIHQEDITIVNIYNKCWCTQFHKTNTTVHKVTGPNIIMVINFNTPFPSIDRLCRPKDKREQKSSKCKLHQKSNGINRYLQNIPSNRYRTYILISSQWNFLQKITYFRPWSKSWQYKKTEIISDILPDHNGK